eukprot:scpid35978/ scgid4624/ Protein slit; Protein slit N-product; Protein slit C-product
MNPEAARMAEEACGLEKNSRSERAFGVESCWRWHCAIVASLVGLLLASTPSLGAKGSFQCPPGNQGCWFVYTDACMSSTQSSAFGGGCTALATVSCSSTKILLANLQVSVVQYYAECPTITEINLENNSLRTLKDTYAITHGMTGLSMLNVARNELTSVFSDWFTSNTDLRLLNLSQNKITSVDVQAFASLSRLEELNLSGNRLSESQLSSTLFSPLKGLERLFLANNLITELPADIFNGLDSLQMINLQNNRIRVVWSESFTAFMSRQDSVLDLSGNNVTSLEEMVVGSGTLHLSSNPLHCDFNLCELVTGKGLQIADLNQAECASPQTVHNTRIQSVYERLSCGTGASCTPHQCEAQQRPKHATCQGNTCTCNAPLYVSNDLQCVCATGARRVDIGVCGSEYGVTCLLNYTCEDVNECEELSGLCPDAQCVNTMGSYKCQASISQPSVASSSSAAAALPITLAVPNCTLVCGRNAECVMDAARSQRCRCVFGFRSSGPDGGCASIRNIGPGEPPSQPTPHSSSTDSLVLVIAIIGGVAGVLALFFVILYASRKFLIHRKKTSLVRHVSQRSTASFMQPNQDYERSSLDSRTFGQAQHKTGINPIYASASESDKKPKIALSILYESGRQNKRHKYTSPQNVLVQDSQHPPSSSMFGGLRRVPPPPINTMLQGSVLPGMPPHTGPKPGAKHPYVVLNAINGEPLTPMTPPCNVTVNAMHMYVSPRDSTATTTSSVSESDLDNLALHRDSFNADMLGRKPVAMIRPYDQATIMPFKQAGFLPTSPIESKPAIQIVDLVQSQPMLRKDMPLHAVREEVTLKQHSAPTGTTAKAASDVQKRTTSPGTESIDS